MALTIKHFPDFRAYLGPSMVLVQSTLQPAPADYVQGGYPITADNVELGKLVGAFITGTNAAGATYVAQFVFPAASLTTATPAGPATIINLKVTDTAAAAGQDQEVAAGTDLSGVQWNATFIGW